MRGWKVRNIYHDNEILKQWAWMVWFLFFSTLVLFLAAVAVMAWFFVQFPKAPEPDRFVPRAQETSNFDPCDLEVVICEGEQENAPTGTTGGHTAIVTAYSKAETCPNRPCVTASGAIAHVGAAACPRSVPLGTKVLIAGKPYTCLDRTAKRFDGRYDIFMDSYDAAIAFGKKQLTVQPL